MKVAVELAIRDFIENIDAVRAEDIGVERIRKLLKDLKVKSIELQHRALKLRVEGLFS